MIYLDTSVLVKLYIKEKHSRETADWIRANNEAIPLTHLHDLEFTNAVHSKEYRAEIASEEARGILSRFGTHESKGIFYRPSFNWTDLFQHAMDLSNRHTCQIGSRSLDILHVAAALSMKVDKFLTFDDRQAALASLAGLNMARIR